MTITEPQQELQPRTRRRRDVVGPDHPHRRAASGIYATIDFKPKEVRECHSTSSIFRGYSLFMKGKDPRDAHFITSRICGICGDNHATCSVYNQNMAYGVAPPHLAEWIINLGEAAEYMFDHNIFQENLVGVDYCERMVKETNPGVLEKANNTEAPHAAVHGYRTIGDIMRVAQPARGRVLPRGAAGQPLHPRDVLPDGGAARPPVDALPGRRRHAADDPALHRLPDPADALRRVHEEGRADARRPVRLLLRSTARVRAVGERRILLGCWGSSTTRRTATSSTAHDRLGREMYVTPGSSSTASWSPTTSSTSTSASGSCSATRSTRTG